MNFFKTSSVSENNDMDSEKPAYGDLENWITLCRIKSVKKLMGI